MSSSSSSSGFDTINVNTDVIVAMASRSYGEGRVFLHTDRIGGFKTGHGDNPKEFWRKILEWTSKKTSNEIIRVGLVINTQPDASDKIHSMKPVSVDKLKNSDLATVDLSNYDCLYIVGLPPVVSSVVVNKITSFVENGGGLVLEYPNIGGEYINVLAGIDNVYCYSSERLLNTYAYWTIDGGNSYVFDSSVDIAFMSTFRQSDFSHDWTILMTNIQNVVVTTTTTSLDQVFDYDRSSGSEFVVSFISSFQNGVVTIEEDPAPIIVSSGDVISVNLTTDSAIFEYISRPSTRATIIINGHSYVVGNIKGQFVWGIGSYAEHVFTYVGEILLLEIDGKFYGVIYNGLGSFKFEVTYVSEGSSSSSSTEIMTSTSSSSTEIRSSSISSSSSSSYINTLYVCGNITPDVTGEYVYYGYDNMFGPYSNLWVRNVEGYDCYIVEKTSTPDNSAIVYMYGDIAAWSNWGLTPFLSNSYTPLWYPASGTASVQVEHCPSTSSSSSSSSNSSSSNSSSSSSSGFKGVEATGGTVTDVGLYRIHTFSNVATETFSVTRGGAVDVLVVAGGGGGGYDYAGGGGAGGVIVASGYSLSSGNYSVTVGAGGQGANHTPLVAQPGDNSIFDSLIAYGGGQGSADQGAAGNGGSGGGGHYTYNAGGSGILGQGNDGGNGQYGFHYAAGGGGGAGSVGESGSVNSGNGGDGISNDFSGFPDYYGGGGGGSTTLANGALRGLGGLGGGGDGSDASSLYNGGNGQDNTGGGGGGSWNASNTSGGNGGSGIVIIRYLK